MAPRKKAMSKKTAAGKKTRQPAGKSPRGSRKKPSGSGGRRSAHKGAGANPARAASRKKTANRAATSASKHQGESATGARPQLVFEALTAILAPYMNQFEAEMHPSLGYCLKAQGTWPNEIHFAAVQWDGEGLTFHLFPIQRHPDLRAQIGPDLRACMKGEQSFRFERMEPELFVQLAKLTATAFERLKSEGLAPPMAAA